MKYMYVLSLTFAFIFNSCLWHRIHGNGIIKSETRDLSSFESITCDGGYNIEVECQAKQSVAIETDENLLPLIKTTVSGTTLHIYTKGHLVPSDEIRITIGVPNLSEFISNGSSEGYISKVNNSELTIETNGSSRLQIDGKTLVADFNTSGSSKIDAASLETEKTKVRINGSGEMYVYATNSIDAVINGSGKVKYKGDPKTVNQQINGSGKIVKE